MKKIIVLVPSIAFCAYVLAGCNTQAQLEPADIGSHISSAAAENSDDLSGAHPDTDLEDFTLVSFVSSFSRTNTAPELLHQLPRTNLASNKQDSFKRGWIVGNYWSFGELEGDLLVYYQENPTSPEAKDYSLQRISFWTFDADLDTFQEALAEINDLLPQLKPFEGSHLEPLAPGSVYSQTTESNTSFEALSGPYLPADCVVQCGPLYLQNSQGEPVQCSVFYEGGDVAKEAWTKIHGTAEAAVPFDKDILTGLEIRLEYDWDII